jgi:hypothetical protein
MIEKSPSLCELFWCYTSRWLARREQSWHDLAVPLPARDLGPGPAHSTAAAAGAPTDPGPQLADAALPSCLGSGGVPTPLRRSTANRPGQLDAGAGAWAGLPRDCLGPDRRCGGGGTAAGNAGRDRVGRVGPEPGGAGEDGPAGGLGQGNRPAQRRRGARPPAEPGPAQARRSSRRLDAAGARRRSQQHICSKLAVQQTE